MRDFVLFILLVALLSGCISNDEVDEYTVDEAVSNGDIVNSLGNYYNFDRINAFIDNVSEGIADQIRITQYTIEGDAIITDLEFDGDTIKYIEDSRRDSYSSGDIVEDEFISIEKIELQVIDSSDVFVEISVFDADSRKLVMRYLKQ